MNIAIIGAGPAGAIAAARLAQAGARVRVFDHSHPREKPCGGGLTARAVALIADLIDLSWLPAVVVDNVSVELPGNSRVAAEVELAGCGLTAASSLIVVSRAALDQTLVHAAVRAGAVLTAERAVDVTRRGRQFIVRTTHGEYHADYLLGADGVNSLVRKKLAAPFTRDHISVAAGYFVHGASNRTIAIQSTLAHPGYLWSFPRADHLAVGACARARGGASSAQMREVSAQWIRLHGLDDPRTTLAPYSWPIPSAGFASKGEMTTSGDGWMLLGDAAGLVDPLTREGIYYALLSGEWAAQALQGPGAPEAAYDDRLRTEVQPELTRAARLSPLFFSPGFSSLLVRALQQSARIREIFVDLVGGTQPYRGLRRRLLSTGQWRLTAQALGLAVGASADEGPPFGGTMNQ